MDIEDDLLTKADLLAFKKDLLHEIGLLTQRVVIKLGAAALAVGAIVAPVKLL